MTNFEHEPSSEMVKDFSTSPETEKKQEIVQLTFDEFLTCVDKHEQDCDDVDCKFNLSTNPEERGRRWDQAAFHMLLMAKLMPLRALPLERLERPAPVFEKWLSEKHGSDSNRPPTPPRVKAQILIPVEEFDRPWAQAYLRSCGDSVSGKNAFYFYTVDQGRNPKQLQKDALKYIKEEAPLMAELAHIANNWHA